MYVGDIGEENKSIDEDTSIYHQFNKIYSAFYKSKCN